MRLEKVTMNYSRKELILKEATMNQMRNSIYILARLMERKGIANLKKRLRKMGQNIARTYIQYWKPTATINQNNLKDVITTIYQKILNSNVSIEIDNNEKLVKVQDYKCALCRYHCADIEIAGCEIIIGMVSELVSLTNEKSVDPSSMFLEPLEVRESRALGNKTCIQLYKYKMGKGG